MSATDAKKVYNYQKRFIYIEAPLYALIITVLLVSWLPAFLSVVAYNTLYPSTIRFGVYLDVTVVIFLIIIGIVRSEIRKTMFLISEDAIVFKAPGKIRQIFFSDITLCKHIQTPLTEQVQIVSPEKSISLPFSINGIYDLILTINEHLITVGKTSVLDEKTNGAMISAACLRKFAYLREKKAFMPLVTSTLFLTVLNIFIAYKIWELDVIPIFMWSVIGFIVPLNVFTFAESLINKQVKKLECRINDDTHAKIAQTNYIFSSILFLIMYLCAGLAFRFIL
jgi:uncharacterized membrane protein YjfL (UPF0719 family)